MTPRCTHPPLGRAAMAATRHRAVIPRICTPRLVLRAPELSDLPLWTDLCTGSDGAHLGGPMTERDAWESFCTYVAGWLLHGHGLWSVERRKDGALVGFVMLGLEWEDLEPELGWMIAPEARGQGFGSEAARAARNHGIKTFGPGGCVSYVHADNTASNRLAASLDANRDATAEAAIGEPVCVWRHGTSTGAVA